VLPSAPQVRKGTDSKQRAKKVAIIVLAALGIIGLAAGLAYFLIIQPPSDGVVDSVEDTGVVDGAPDTEADESEDEPEAGKGDEETEPEEEFEPELEPVEDVQEPAAEDLTVDTDGDGLTDSEEEDAGTDPSLTDTDADGLGDREEVQVYGTDPLDSDTDGDTYSDGDEVSAGYNPNGDGKLFEIPNS